MLTKEVETDRVLGLLCRDSGDDARINTSLGIHSLPGEAAPPLRCVSRDDAHSLPGEAAPPLRCVSRDDAHSLPGEAAPVRCVLRDDDRGRPEVGISP